MGSQITIGGPLALTTSGATREPARSYGMIVCINAQAERHRHWQSRRALFETTETAGAVEALLGLREASV